jgi:hypothetical protein
MSYNFYLNERLAKAHRQELLREAERGRLLAELPMHRRSVSRHIAGQLGALLLWLGVRLKQFEQKFPTVLEDHP